MYTKAVSALLGLRCPQGSGRAFEMGPASIAAKRNELVQRFLNLPDNFEWLFFLDSDMTPPPDTVLELLATGHDAITGLAFNRTPPFKPACGWRRPAGGYDHLVTFDGAVHAIGVCGAACLLLRRRVFERIAPPWFEHPPETPGLEEDVVFCDKLTEAGTRLYCHTGVVVGHLTVVSVDGGPLPAPAAWEDKPAR